MTCPVCKRDDLAYLRCDYPGCPDGRQPTARADTRYSYDGFLSGDVRDSIAREGRKYPFPVELRAFPAHDRMQEVFSDRTWEHYGENCMGQETQETRQGIPWCWIARNFATDDKSGFLMLPDADAHRRFVAAFPELILDAHPFRTLIEPARKAEIHAMLYGDQKPGLIDPVRVKAWWTRLATWKTFGRAMIWLCIGFLVAIIFSGCVSGPPVNQTPACATCIGPYDLTLSSHREALGL